MCETIIILTLFWLKITLNEFKIITIHFVCMYIFFFYQCKKITDFIKYH